MSAGEHTSASLIFHVDNENDVIDQALVITARIDSLTGLKNLVWEYRTKNHWWSN